MSEDPANVVDSAPAAPVPTAQAVPPSSAKPPRTAPKPKDYGNPFKGFSGFYHLLQAIWVAIWNPFGLHSYFAAIRIVKTEFGKAIERGKVMYLMPVCMMTIYCTLLQMAGVPIIVLGPMWWLWLMVCIYTAVSDVETRWIALPIGGVLASAGVLTGLVVAGVIDLSGIIGDFFNWVAFEFPTRGALAFAIVIFIWNLFDFVIRGLLGVLLLQNNTYSRGRLSKESDYPAGDHRVHSHVPDWLEMLLTFSTTIAVKSVYSDKPDREDDNMERSVVVLKNVPLGGLLKRAFTHATSTTNVERSK